MSQCPGCGAALEEGAEICFECGELILGDLPQPQPKPATTTPPPPPPLPGAATKPVPAAPLPPKAVKRMRIEEPEPRRCPACGLKSMAARCPNDGTRLREDE